MKIRILFILLGNIGKLERHYNKRNTQAHKAAVVNSYSYEDSNKENHMQCESKMIVIKD